MRPNDPRIRRQLAPAGRELLTVVAAGAVSSALVLAQAWAVASLLVAGAHGDSIRTPALAVLVVLGLRGTSGWVSDLAAARAAAVVGTDLRRRLVQRLISDPHQGSTGEVTVLATRGVAAAAPYLTRYLPALVLAVVLPPLAVLAMATQDLLSAVIVLATLPLVPVFAALVGIATRDRAAEQWREMSSLSGHFLDVVNGLPTLVAHRRARAQSARIAAITDRYRRASMRTLRIAFASSLVLELVATLSVALVAVTAGVRVANGSLGLHTALVVLLLAPEAYWPLRRVGAEFHAAAEGATTFEKAHAIIDLPPTAPHGAAAAPGQPLVLQGVSVVRAGRRHPALAPLDAVIQARGITVVTGASGSGKTTLLDALVGLLPLSAGSLTCAGVEVGGSTWQAQVSRLPQRPCFVAGTIADNLRLARPAATDDELWTALRRVVLEERVQAMGAGLDGVLGEDGGSLSAGERARLALARIIVADRPWVLLDEPTAHLDDLTEMVIADTLIELSRRHAVVVVAHRPALVALADHRIRLDPPVAAAPVAARSERTRRVATAPIPAGSPDLPRPHFAGSTVLGALASTAGVALTATAGWLIVQASTRPALLTLAVAIVAVRTFGLARPVLRYVERLQSHDAALRLLARRRVQVYDALVPLTPGRLGRRRGDVLTSVVSDVDSVVDKQLRVRLPVCEFALVAGLATLVAALATPSAAVVVASTALVAGAGGYGLARLGAARAEQRAVAVRAELSDAVVEVTQLADELRMWQAGGRALDRVCAISDRLGLAGRTSAGWTGAARALVLTTCGVGVGVMTAVSAGPVSTGRLSGPVMALLVLIPLALAEVALPVADAGALAVRTAAAEQRLHQLERLAPAVRDTVFRTATDSHRVDVHRVRARWQPDAPLTVECSLQLEAGDRVAVIGGSGSGKSTLAALMLRFLDPDVGTIEHGGVALRDLALDDVRRLTGLVDDDPYVFATSLVENVRLASPTASDADVEDALRRAGLGGWLDSLPDALGTWLGDGHDGISGGERARLAVARSLLADQPVLVLDEPAAHLDHATASVLAHELLTGPRRRSVVWITHDAVGLDLVDRVIDLGGRPSFADPVRPPRVTEPLRAR